MAQHAASTTTTPDTALGVVGRALSFVALLLAVLAAAVLIVVPMATGSQTYSVLTNSMRPHLPPGTLLVSRPVAFQDLRVGDVITYQLESGQADVITHRIVTTSSDQQGNTLFITQGDNNALPDEAPVREIQVRGKLFYAVPYAGFLANWLGNQDRGMGAQIAAVVLIGYGAWNVVAGMLSRRRNSRNEAVVVGGAPSEAGTPEAESAAPASPRGAGRPQEVPPAMPVRVPVPEFGGTRRAAQAAHHAAHQAGRRRRERVSR